MSKKKEPCLGALIEYALARPAGRAEGKHRFLFMGWVGQGCGLMLVRMLWRLARDYGVTELSADEWDTFVFRFYGVPDQRLPAKFTRSATRVSRREWPMAEAR